MADVLFLAILVAFFALCVVFVKACERIIGPDVEAARVEAGRRPTDGTGRGMTGAESVIGLVLSVLVDRVPRVRARCSRRSSDDGGRVGCNSSSLIALLAISTPLLGTYMAKVYGGGKAPGRPGVRPGRARSSTASCGVDPTSEQRWQTYALSLLAFSFASRASCSTRSSGSRVTCRSTPTTSTGVEADALVQHRGQLPHQHELAELLGRVDDVAPHARWPGSRCTTSCRRRPAPRSRSR